MSYRNPLHGLDSQGDRIPAVYVAETGLQEAVVAADDNVPDFDGTHLWSTIVMYRIDPTNNGPQVLDHVNRMTVTPPGCYHCEQVYRSGMENTPCPGEPDA